MKILHAPTELDGRGRKVCLAIGFFDGVHLGHQQIIRQTIADACQHEAIALVLTFDRHPNTVVAPDRTPPLIYSLSQRLRYVESLGPDALLLIHFDEPFSRKTGEQFFRELVGDLGHVKSLCVGSDFHFGHQRNGDVALLKRLGDESGFTVHGMAAVSLDGLPIRSTRIREAIRSGDLDLASQMLGRAYSLAGQVISGDGFGRQLDFPTANLDATGLALPTNGVYAVHARVGEVIHRAVLNIGCRPTRQNPNPQLHVEVHLLDFDGDLYGQELEVAFVEKLRDERMFPSADALRAQIARDIAEARLRY